MFFSKQSRLILGNSYNKKELSFLYLSLLINFLLAFNLLVKRYQSLRFQFQLSIYEEAFNPDILSSAKFLVCFNFQSAEMSIKVGETVV